MSDVIVIGGGIVGCATAYYLAKDGADVVLLEQGCVNGAASGANAGSLHCQIPHDQFVAKGPLWARRFLAAVRLYRASLAMWAGLESELECDLEYRAGGGLLIAANDAEMAQIAHKAKLEHEAGLDVTMMSAGDLQRLAPYLRPGLAGGALCAGEGKANPTLAAPAFAAMARRSGARIIENAAVNGITRDGPGFEVSVGTVRHRARRIVIAAGSGSRVLASYLGGALPIEAHPIQVSATRPIAPFIGHLIYAANDKLTLKQSQSGAVVIGGGWAGLRDAAGRPVVDPATLAINLQLAVEAVPMLEHVEIARSWAAFASGTEDWMPILGEMRNARGCYINFVPWMGFSAGPAVGRLTADMVMGRPLFLDIAPFAACL